MHKIIGNTVGIPNPQSDFNQTDPTKADYIKNKPEGMSSDTELKLRDERLKYYGDPDIIPTDESFFDFISFDVDEAAVRILYNKEIEELVIPYECTVDGEKYKITHIITPVEFEDIEHSSIKKVVIPNTVSFLRDNVFANYTNLTDVNMPNSITNIGERAFYNCPALHRIDLSTNVREIGKDAFLECGGNIYCAEGSYADTYVKENGIYVYYTNEVTKEFVLANGGKPNVIQPYTKTLVLEDNQDARFEEISSLVLTMPENIENTYHSSFNFKSGETPTSLTYTDTPIIWRGDDCDSDGDFIPEANTIYEVSVKNLGTNGIVARVGAI